MCNLYILLKTYHTFIASWWFLTHLKNISQNGNLVLLTYKGGQPSSNWHDCHEPFKSVRPEEGCVEIDDQRFPPRPPHLERVGIFRGSCP